MKKKMICLIFIMSLALMLSRCGNNDESIRLQVYKTDYKGTPTTSYPYKMLTDNNIFKIIDSNSNDEELEVEKLRVLYLVNFYDEENHLNKLMVMNNGKISLMRIGLKLAEYIVTEKGLTKVIDEIEK